LITFDEGNMRFDYRVAGVVIDDGRVLLEKVEGWSLPGGRGELLEPAEETLKREMREELSIEIKVNRLLWVVENFFTGNDFHTGDEMSCHEMGLYFMVELPESSQLRELAELPGVEKGFRRVFKWYPINILGNITLVPSFLQKSLKKISDSTEHIVHTEVSCKFAVNRG